MVNNIILYYNDYGPLCRSTDRSNCSKETREEADDTRVRLFFLFYFFFKLCPVYDVVGVDFL